MRLLRKTPAPTCILIDTLADQGVTSTRHDPGAAGTLKRFMSSALYLLGYALIIAGLALGAHYMHIATHWIVVGIVILAGMGIVGVSKKRR